MTCICKEMRTDTLCINFSMNFKNSSTRQANSASTADNKLPIEPHTLRAILMCHIKSQHKASATGPTQMCFFQIPPARSSASLFSRHRENTVNRFRWLPSHQTSNLIPLWDYKDYILPRLTYKHQHEAQDSHKPISTVFITWWKYSTFYIQLSELYD